MLRELRGPAPGPRGRFTAEPARAGPLHPAIRQAMERNAGREASRQPPRSWGAGEPGSSRGRTRATLFWGQVPASPPPPMLADCPF